MRAINIRDEIYYYESRQNKIYEANVECTKAGYERSHVAHGVTRTVKDRMAGDCPEDGDES